MSNKRCPICDWPMADSREKGCVPGDCSYRPDDPAEQQRIKRRREQLTEPYEAPPRDWQASPSREPASDHAPNCAFWRPRRALQYRCTCGAPEREPASDLPDWDDLRGCAPDATSGLPSEEFVRKLRDGWIDRQATAGGAQSGELVERVRSYVHNIRAADEPPENYLMWQLADLIEALEAELADVRAARDKANTELNAALGHIEYCTKQLAELRTTNERMAAALRKLARNVSGIWEWGGYKTELRTVIGNTNYRVVSDCIEEARAALAAGTASAPAERED